MVWHDDTDWRREHDDGTVDDLPQRAAAQARDARAEVLRAFLRLREQGLDWARGPEHGPPGASGTAED